MSAIRENGRTPGVIRSVLVRELATLDAMGGGRSARNRACRVATARLSRAGCEQTAARRAVAGCCSAADRDGGGWGEGGGRCG